MADSIVKLKVDSAEYDNKLKRAAEGIQHLAAKIHDSQGEFVGLDNEQKEFIKNLQYMNTVSHTAAGKVRELETAYKGLQTMYNGFTAFEKNSEEGRILAEQLSILREKTIQARSEMENANRSISNTGGFLDQLKSKFTVNIDALSLFNKGLSVAKGALDVAGDAFMASESTVDEWGRVMDSSKSLYEGFLTALNTGDISGYLSRIDEIVSAARAAYNELDRLGTMKTIQAPRISAQQTENERMRMMIQTGRYIAPVDGRRATMADGQILSKDQIRRIEQQLQGGMQTMVQLVGNEVKQTGRAIDAVYRRQAAELGMSLKEFRAGTASMANFDKRMQGYDNYQKWRASHTTIDQQSGREIVARGNPFEQFAKWGVFRVDGQRYNDLVKLIQQRDQQAAQAYSMQGQAYRTMNRAEGFTVRSIMNGGGGSGSGATVTTPIPVKIEGFDPLKAATAGVQGVDTMPSVHGMADHDALRAAMGIAPQQWDAKQDVSKSWHVGRAGELTQDSSNKRKEDKKDRTQEQADKTVVGEMGKLTSGVQGIFSGIEQMGITVPDEIKGVINGIQGVMTILTSINTILGVIEGLQAVNAIPFFARGGVVPHAATGMVIPGHDYSDSTLVAASSGEVIMNKAQQGSLISQLEGAQRPVQVSGRIEGEDIILAANRTFRRKGQGEIVTW